MTISSTNATRTRSLIFVLFAVAAFALAVTSFWPSYFGPVLTGVGTVDPIKKTWVIPTHAIYFLGWIGLFCVQAFLVQSGNTKLHRRLRFWFAGYGALGVVLGIVAVFWMALRRIAHGSALAEEATYLFPGLMDMAMFAGFLAAAVAYRSKPQTHKRLMVMATCVLTIIGLGRLVPRFIPGELLGPGIVATLVFAAPIWLAIITDVAITRRLHPVYWIAIPIFALKVNQSIIMDSPIWNSIGQALLRPFL